MRCVLMLPSWQPSDFYPPGTLRSQISYQHCIGLLYVATMLKNSGNTILYIDGSFVSHQKILDQIKDFKPDFVGIYTNTPLWKRIQKAAGDIKQILPNTKIGIGGPLPAFFKKETLEECIDVDVAFYEEGEYASVEYINSLKNSIEPTKVKGIVYRNNQGRIIQNQPAGPIKNLDSLPYPDRSLLGDLNKYESPPGTFKKKPIVNIMTSRGCTNRCLYCFQANLKAEIRYRSPENVLGEFEECIKKYGFRELRILDDNFLADNDRAIEICRKMIERKLVVPWYCSSRVDNVNPELLKYMKKSGCWCVLYGVETGIQKNLDMLRKNITLDQIRQAVKWTKKAGIKVYTPFIFGIPGETIEEGMKTIDFACELDAHFVNFHTLAPYPGTDLYDNSCQYGMVDPNIEKYTFEHIAFVPYTMTREEIISLRRIANQRFYSRPKFILNRILAIRNFYDLKTLYQGAISLKNIIVNKNTFDPDLINQNQT